MIMATSFNTDIFLRNFVFLYRISNFFVTILWPLMFLFARCTETLEQCKGLEGFSVKFVYPDPYVFGLPGSASGSISHKYGSGSRSRLRILPSSKKERKTLISTVLFCDFFMTFYQCSGSASVGSVCFWAYRGTGPRIRIRIRIHTKMSQIHNTGFSNVLV